MPPARCTHLDTTIFSSSGPSSSLSAARTRSTYTSGSSPLSSTQSGGVSSMRSAHLPVWSTPSRRVHQLRGRIQKPAPNARQVALAARAGVKRSPPIQPGSSSLSAAARAASARSISPVVAPSGATIASAAPAPAAHSSLSRSQISTLGYSSRSRSQVSGSAFPAGRGNSSGLGKIGSSMAQRRVHQSGNEPTIPVRRGGVAAAAARAALFAAPSVWVISLLRYLAGSSGPQPEGQ